jgi:hypothetical protein
VGVAVIEIDVHASASYTLTKLSKDCRMKRMLPNEGGSEVEKSVYVEPSLQLQFEKYGSYHCTI